MSVRDNVSSRACTAKLAQRIIYFAAHGQRSRIEPGAVVLGHGILGAKSHDDFSVSLWMTGSEDKRGEGQSKLHGGGRKGMS